MDYANWKAGVCVKLNAVLSGVYGLARLFAVANQDPV